MVPLKMAAVKAGSVNRSSAYRTPVRMLAMDKGDRARMGANGRALVAEKFDENLVVEATLRAVEAAAMA